MRHVVIRTHELQNPDYAKNPPNRCYFCKEELFNRLEPLATLEGGAQLIYGANMSVDKVKEKGKKIAAHLLEASVSDIEYTGGQFHVRGAPGKSVPFGAVALTAYVPHNYPEGLEPGLEETSFYDPSNFCFPFGPSATISAPSAMIAAG